MNPDTGPEPHLVFAWAYWLEDDAEARKILDHPNTSLRAMLVDNDDASDGPDWLLFPLDPDVSEEIERLGIAGGWVSGYLLSGYTVDARLSSWDDRWMGHQQRRLAFFTNEGDAERALRQLRDAQKDQP